ncbi:MAG TPA: hypothetical protein VKH19_18940, partial [Gemmatimonadaceae bacterium]|nr:hypothetical protein [Gemmatimonadaceae bacterium]
MIDDIDDTNAFVERIAKTLRTDEHADSSFRTTVMTAVQNLARTEGVADQPRLSPSGGTRLAERRMPRWWKRSYWIRITPLSGFAVAASALIVAVGLFMLSGYSLASGRRPQEVAVRRETVHDSVRDTVHIVRFVFVDSSARSVSLVGEFNQWQKDATALRAGTRPGVWTVDVPLTGGRHEYAYIVRD